MVDGPRGPLHRRGRHPQGRHPQRRHHLLRLPGPRRSPRRGGSADSNSISSFDSPSSNLSTYGSKFRGFILKYDVQFILHKRNAPRFDFSI